MAKTYGQLRQELSAINLTGKTEKQTNAHQILVNWAKDKDEDAPVSAPNLREIERRIERIKRDIIPMSEITKKKIGILNDAFQETLCILYERWQEEKEYEEWDDYIKSMTDRFKALIIENNMNNAVYYSCSKRPFGLTFDFEGHRVVMSVNSTHTRWRSKQI